MSAARGVTPFVFNITIQHNNKILIGGTFKTITGVTRSNIARLNPDGSLDVEFNPVVNNRVYTIVPQRDRKILIGGIFTAVGDDVLKKHMARLNADGSIDNDFNPNVGNVVYTIVPQNNGQILIGGEFTEVGDDVLKRRIARLNADGSIDNDFNLSPNGVVYAVSPQNNGQILIGGGFVEILETEREYIARLGVEATKPVTESVSANENPTTVDWLRSGPTALLSYTTLEIATKGSDDYQPLINGESIPGGWRFTLTSPLLLNHALRFRGRTSAGIYNSSSLLIETVSHDSDHDGVYDGSDNCPLHENLDQANNYGNLGENADGKPCALEDDNCTEVPAVGDICDDSDNDGKNDDVDNPLASGFCFPVMGANATAVICL